MKSQVRACFSFLGWVALIHLLTTLLGIGLLFLLFDPLGSGSGISFFALCIPLSWLLLGWLTPKKARPGWAAVFLTLLGWALLTWLYYRAFELYNLLPSFPQYLTGAGLAQMCPGSSHSWYLWTLEPYIMTLAHFLLPAAAGLGLLLPRPRKEGRT